MIEIRAMRRDEVDLAAEWAAREGWNPGLADADPFYATDPGGWFVATENGEPQGMISAIAYDDTFGFIGFFIVHPGRRGGRIGTMLGQVAQRHLEGRIVGLDGVEAKVENYKAFGYVLAYNNARYAGTTRAGAHAPGIIPLGEVPYAALLAYDTAHFPVARGRFLERWIAMPGAVGLACLRGGRLAGYGMIRASRTGFRIGPLFAEDGAAAEALFSGLSAAVPEGRELFLDIPVVNDAARALVERHGMTCVFRTARMYGGGMPELPLHEIFGVTSFELG